MKHYKRLYLLLIPALLLLVNCQSSGEEGQQEQAHARHTATYTCPMHPQIVQDEPGTCPICGMALVAQSVVGEEVALSEELEYLLQPTNQTVVSSIALTTPVRKAMDATVPMEGIITYDPNRLYTIPARVGGRIEQLYVKYNYQPIRKGQKLMEIYSPELVTAQKELLYLVQAAPEDKMLIEGATQRLLLLGATEEQIQRIIRTGEASYTFAIYSPYSGYVVGLNNTPPTATPAGAPARSSASSGAAMGGMGGSNAAQAPTGGMPSTAGGEMQLREGMYVDRGQSLLRVVNTTQLWAEFNIPAGYISSVAKGAPVQISFPQLPEEQLEAKIDFFQPFYDAGENYAKVRVYLPGEQSVALVGQLVSGKAHYTTPPTLWVPKEAVLDLGTRSVVFVSQGAAFKPVAVTTGITEKGQTQILEGLQASDKVASNAQFMVDSESFIRTAAD